ncbi:hypothetical protein FB451DRAFT_1567800 [Mycena latifolia]|nr:hypothetical protein FB451DRAFT_1567800 [Mycena latifolia]
MEKHDVFRYCKLPQTSRSLVLTFSNVELVPGTPRVHGPTQTGDQSEFESLLRFLPPPSPASLPLPAFLRFPSLYRRPVHPAPASQTPYRVAGATNRKDAMVRVTAFDASLCSSRHAELFFTIPYTSHEMTRELSAPATFTLSEARHTASTSPTASPCDRTRVISTYFARMLIIFRSRMPPNNAFGWRFIVTPSCRVVVQQPVDAFSLRSHPDRAPHRVARVLFH